MLLVEGEAAFVCAVGAFVEGEHSLLVFGFAFFVGFVCDSLQFFVELFVA